jgi:uncharacterized protein YjiS (DUF1127 family)
MHKETSSRVSSIAARILNTHQVSVVTNPSPGIPFIEKRLYDDLLNDAKTLAASCMSQDETPGQEKLAGDFHSRLKNERKDLDERLTALNSFLTHNPGHPNPRHHSMLREQARLMSELLAVIDERLCDIAISERSAPVEEIEDHDDGA